MAVTITDDRQVVIWDDPNGPPGMRQSEHRSVGHMGYVDTSDSVWVREPREVDPVYVVCCGPCSRFDSAKPFAGGHRRAHVIAEHPSEFEATDLAKLHADAHRLAKLSFSLQQIIAYKRQRRLERDLG